MHNFLRVYFIKSDKVYDDAIYEIQMDMNAHKTHQDKLHETLRLLQTQFSDLWQEGNRLESEAQNEAR